jgi:glycosyltransferase involved in cell wall biosynthesis
MSEHPPLISVIIATYNYGCYVCAAVESALAQTYPSIEIIVVDDGSTDDTQERLRMFGPQVRCLVQKNSGVSTARNRGINAATGEYLAFLDADDQFHPQKLELQMKQFSGDPTLDLVGTGQMTSPSPKWNDQLPEDVECVILELEEIVIRPRFALSSALIRRKCIEEVGAFDPSLPPAEDRDLWIRVANRFRVAVLPLPLIWYRITAGSLSQNPERMEQKERIVLDRAFEMPQLRQNWVLRRKALGIASLGSCYDYRAAGRPVQAIKRLICSLLWWPLPFRRSEVTASLVRLRVFFVTARMILFGSRSAPRPDKRPTLG